jgi:hypothetical protein
VGILKSKDTDAMLYAALIAIIIFLLLAFMGAGVLVIRWRKHTLRALDLSEQLIEQNAELSEQNKKLVAHIKDMQQQFFEKLHNLLCDFFEGSSINHYIIRVDAEGELSILIGEDDNLVPVDMVAFTEDPPAALERAKFEWMAKD